MPRAINPYGRTVKREQAHFVYQSYDGLWTWYVLKTYQAPENEGKNPYARWYCTVVSPLTSERGETGDVYCAEVKAQAYRLSYNPLAKLTDEEIIALWQALKDVPLASDETTDQDFNRWPKGTPVFEIWQWFDEHYSKGVAALLDLTVHTDVQTSGKENLND